MVNTGWERDRRGHFDEIVSSYDAVRPDYPAELFSDIFAYAPRDRLSALEIGAGTGKATKAFLESGYTVTAVEISENMRAFLKERFAGDVKLRVEAGAFEDAVLPENAFDTIYAASAFHWVDANVGCPKAFRLLKSGGCLCLFRYNWMNDDVFSSDGFAEIYDKYYFSHYEKQPPRPKKTREYLSSKDGIMSGFRFSDMADYGFTGVQTSFYDKEYFYTAEKYISVLDTMSDYRALPDEKRLPLYESLERLILASGGGVNIKYCFQLYMGRKP